MATSSQEWRLPLPALASTERLAADLAAFLKLGECLALSGEIGTGKTTLARAIIRQLAGNAELDVPSPSFSLVQTYAFDQSGIVHADLYRLKDHAEIDELGLEELAEGQILIIEWPERMGAKLPADRINVRFELGLDRGKERREAVLSAHGRCVQRFIGWKAIGSFLHHSGFGDYARVHIQGDAGARRYERLVGKNDSAILMIAPPRTDNKPIRAGKSYLQLAHLSETVHAFSAVAKALRGHGFVAPKILAEDLDGGLLVAEDLGDISIADNGVPVPERYIATAEALADLHGIDWPAEAPVEDNRVHALPSYDLEAYLIEAELLLDWYIPADRRGSFTGASRARFVAAWTETLAEVLAGDRTWTLRDVHSPNVLWQPHAKGRDRIGFIDIQDTLIGHPAYDLASLAQDARLEVPQELEVRIIAAYCRKRGFDEAARTAFLRAYVILASQRATKILGIFARLDERDGKPHYRRHIPRIEAVLKRNLAHPAMASVQAWMKDALPAVFAS
jgi:N-acetylmuramate 1-kinase